MREREREKNSGLFHCSVRKTEVENVGHTRREQGFLFYYICRLIKNVDRYLGDASTQTLTHGGTKTHTHSDMVACRETNTHAPRRPHSGMSSSTPRLLRCVQVKLSNDYFLIGQFLFHTRVKIKLPLCSIQAKQKKKNPVQINI